LPVVDEVANDYVDDVTFLAVAGRGDLGATQEEAARLFSDNINWGLDDSIWDLYGVPGQPATVLIVDGVVVDGWFGALGVNALRERLDNLVALSS
jgi:thioredoxin-like negative regulator of GroEL